MGNMAHWILITLVFTSIKLLIPLFYFHGHSWGGRGTRAEVAVKNLGQSGCMGPIKFFLPISVKLLEQHGFNMKTSICRHRVFTATTFRAKEENTEVAICLFVICSVEAS